MGERIRGSEGYLANPRQRDLVLKESVRGRAELGDLLVRKPMSPFLRMLPVVLGLPKSRARDLLGEFVEGVDMVGERGVLAGGFQAVGEDVHRGGGLGESGHCEGTIKYQYK